MKKEVVFRFKITISEHGILTHVLVAVIVFFITLTASTFYLKNKLSQENLMYKTECIKGE